MNKLILLYLAINIVFAVVVMANDKESHQVLTIKSSQKDIVIDGKYSPEEWQHIDWQYIKQPIIGELPELNDFSGRFKLTWDQAYLYLIAEITDDNFYDRYSNPLDNYWNDDCLEIFIDEDNSGGEHLANNNAFAYHLALDNQVVDLALNLVTQEPEPRLYNHHVKNVWRYKDNKQNTIYWEAAIKLFDDNYLADTNENSAVKLTENKKIGFMLAYCDNDNSEIREHFIGSVDIVAPDGDKNIGYKTADVFQTYILKQ